MRLNYNKWPIWEAIDARTVGDRMRILELSLGAHIQEAGKTKEFKGLMNSLLSNAKKVSVCSNPFTEAFTKALDKIDPTIPDNYVRDHIGVIVFKKFVFLYIMGCKDEAQPLKHKLMSFFGKPGGFFGYGMLTHDNRVFGYVPLHEINVRVDIIDEVDAAAALLQILQNLIYFIDNCELEVKELKPKEKMKIKDSQKQEERYFNETKYPVQIIDCTWFTTLIRDTPIDVEGHFRWQAVGKGWSKHRLIWVPGYQKKGFTRRAKKLTSELP